MQHNAATTQQSQAVVSGSHSHVTRYVNVISAKVNNSAGQLKTTDSIKTINPQGRQMITLPGRVLSASNPINVIRRIPTAANQNTNRPHLNIGIVSSTPQQLYSSSQHQFTNESSTDNNVYNNNSPSSSYQNFGETNNLLYSSNQQQTSNGFFVESSPSVTSQVNVNTSPHQGNLNHSGNDMGSSNQNSGIGQIVSSPGGSTYLLQGNSAHENGIVAMPLSQTNRASPATVSHFRREPKTVQWLMDHFENAEGVSLPRALMYNHYLLHCQEQRLDPVNAASFGKLVRSVFLGLRTRRLGTRGNSKYHYYGIRIKVNSPLNALQDEIGYLAMRYHQSNDSKTSRNKTSLVKSQQDAHQAQISITEQVEQQAQQHQQFLGDATQALPDLDPIQILSQDLPLPDNITHENLLVLEDLYRDHCASILDAIVNLQFSAIENLWYTFWRVDCTTNSQMSAREELEMKLSRQKFMSMCLMAPVQRWIKDSDHMIYQSLVEVLIPDVLRPIPSALTQAIRNFAKGLEGTLTSVLNKTQLPKELIQFKIAAVSAFSQTLRRYTSLNHLAQAARAVLNNVAQINQMLSDLNRVDFNNIQEQASWVCQCKDSVVREFEVDFKAALSEQRSLEQWADWLESVVNKVLQQVEDRESITKVAREFLLKWSFYSSLVIRDLTLRSAASFGSFHLIRLLYDEYMFYLVEHRVAQATGETTIAIMNDFAATASKPSTPDVLCSIQSNLPSMLPAKSVDSSAAQESSAITSQSTAAATFIASAPIANVNVSIVKSQDKGLKRSATVAMLDNNQTINNSSNSNAAEKQVNKLETISKISPLITISTTRSEPTTT